MSSGSDSGDSTTRILRDHLKSVRAIAQSRRDPDGDVTNYQSKVQEGLRLKEQVIALTQQLKIAQESTNLQAAEFAFQRSEYIAEIDHLKSREIELRSLLIRLSKDKDEYFHDIEEKFSQQIDDTNREKNDFLQTLQVQVTRLRSKLIELQSENEVLTEDLHRVKQSNSVLSNQLQDQKEIYENKIALLEALSQSGEAKSSSSATDFRQKIQNLEKRKVSLENDLKVAQRTISDLTSALALGGDREKLLSKQLSELTDTHAKISSDFAEESRKSGNLRAENAQLQNQIALLQTEVKTVNVLLTQIEDNTRYTRQVSYCSPLQRTRIEILKQIHHEHEKLCTAAFQLPQDNISRIIQIRNIVLAVIFTKRWIRYTKNTDICDNSGGLRPFEAVSRVSPLQMVVFAKNEIVSLQAHALQMEEKLSDADGRIRDLSRSNGDYNQSSEAAFLQVRTFRKCNRILHKQLNSFAQFHREMLEFNESK
jgi:DNA repair exonuclease SbcCD ATPase subunit